THAKTTTGRVRSLRSDRGIALVVWAPRHCRNHRPRCRLFVSWLVDGRRRIRPWRLRWLGFVRESFASLNGLCSWIVVGSSPRLFARAVRFLLASEWHCRQTCRPSAQLAFPHTRRHQRAAIVAWPFLQAGPRGRALL